MNLNAIGRLLIGATITVSLALSVSFASANSGQQIEPHPLTEPNGNRVGWIHRFGPRPSERTRRGSTPIVFVSGFELDASEIMEGATSVSRGDRASGRRLLDSLSSEDGSRAAFFRWLVDIQGFTVYVVEPADPDASIQASARALEEALTDETYELRQYYRESGSRSVIAGWSMGGVIARYALTRLERQGRDHGADLYVSIDAPHRGAFLPTSLEILVRSMVDLDREALPLKFKGERIGADTIPTEISQPFAAFQDKLDTPAARQLLGTYAKTDGSMSFNFLAGNTTALQSRYDSIWADGSQSAHPSFYALRNEMLMLGGYPGKTRNVGVTHGAMDGTRVFPLGISEGDAFQLTVKAWWNCPGSGGCDKNALRLWVYHDWHTQRRGACKVKLGGSDSFNIDKSWYCPAVRMPARHAGVVTASGGTLDALGRIDAELENLPDPVVGKFAGRNILTRIEVRSV